ncbi:MAG: hypothetical protein GQ470_06250, partial [Gammaproteobacteria bacterium]|nr:hypothetical protein [Gammaproteobacteria bacterium]
MSGVFNRGFLKMGYPLYPILRGNNIKDMEREIPDPELVLIAVGETDIHTAIGDIPPSWSDRTVLLQNELLPKDWEGSQLKNPTVISVWFEKKRGQEYKVIVPSPIFGPNAELVNGALTTLNIPSWIVANDEELLFELVRKNLYILTSNIAGLALPEGATVGELSSDYQQLMQSVSSEILKIQYSLIGKILDSSALLRSMMLAFNGDLNHKCMGRSAPARLKRALKLSQKENITTPTL